MRRAARVDGNHAEIVAALRKAGCTVLDLSRQGGECPDLALGYGGLTALAEVKNPERKWSYTDAQKKWRQTWTGGCLLLTSTQDALEAAATLRQWSERLRQC